MDSHSAHRFYPPAGAAGTCLLVNKKMQAGARAKAGDKVQIRLEPDLEEQVFVMPIELKNELKADRELQRWFDRLSPFRRKWTAYFVDQAKGAETRASRAAKIAESLMLAMEGEQEPPPILRAAFLRQPLAREGWDAMTATQRRNHLLGIFYVQTVEGQREARRKGRRRCPACGGGKPAREENEPARGTIPVPPL